MGVINVLDKHVAELIAAGEVVERPASVIKELVENAIDAGAKNITVEIKNGGTTFMRVTDDGCGIAKDDVRVAFLRHATSKVSQEEDLEKIATLGFRGEALASVSAVSRLQLITKSVNEDVGSAYVIEGGEEKSFDDAGCPAGTTFVIRDLFYNIPARAKFLKKDVSEGNAVSNVIDKTALSHPEIAFTYIRDGRQALKTFGDGKLMSAIYSVYGREFASGLIPVDYRLDAIHVYGFVSKPVHARPNRNMQNFFINGRYVRPRTATAALEEAFKHSIMVGKFPSCVLNIDLPYEIIDVNVHPSKIEVRFLNERPVFDAVYHAVKSALMQHDTKKQASFKNETAFHDIKQFNPFKNADAIIKDSPKREENPVQRTAPVTVQARDFDILNVAEQQTGVVRDASDDPFDIISDRAVSAAKKEARQSHEYIPDSKPLFENTAIDPTSKPLFENTAIDPNSRPLFANSAVDPKQSGESAQITKEEKAEKPEPAEVIIKENSQPRELFRQPENELKYIGEAFGTYIIVERNQKELMLIDKHAAHERIIYERLKAESADAVPQLLLQPVTVTLGRDEYDAAVNHLDMFGKCAFEVEDFGNSTLIVRGAPQYLDAADIPDCIAEMSDYIAQGKNDIYTENMDRFYHTVACRSAVKAGNKSSAQELIELVKILEDNPDIRYCPHGRPITVIMKKKRN